MPFPDCCLLAVLALAIEAAVGYPDWLWRAIGHPVSWIGRIIAGSEALLNRPVADFAQRRIYGALALAVWVVVGVAIAVLLAGLAPPTAFGVALLAVPTSSLLAQRSLYRHVAAVADALDTSLAAGRIAVGHIVGRDVSELDESGVARAAIESLAENLSDGIVAPALWIAAAGLPGGVFYKTVNTADSLVGHRSERYAAFGFAAARVDDLVNWPAARLSGALICLASLPDRAASAQAWTMMRRDAPRHRSPNAGWPEAAMAGALGLRLGGPRRYDGVRVVDGFMGDGRAAAGISDIRAALRLYIRALGLLWCLLASAALVLL